MKVTLITGASTGIGQATALHLARQGHHVFASMRTPSTGAAPLIEAAAKENLNIDIVQLDVNDQQSAEAAVQTVVDKAGRLDVLVNNAGIGGGTNIEEMSEELLRSIFETNFFGAMRMMKLAIPIMRQNQSGAIINISSVSGVLAGPGGSAYAGSKFALEAASESLAQEVYRFNIRVAIVEPGVIATPIFTKGSGEEPDPSSPYHEFNERALRLFTSRLANPGHPMLVAEIIQHAIETDEPKLRYPAGEDAKLWIAGRKAMTDEEWIASGRKMDIEEYAAQHAERFGIEI